MNLNSNPMHNVRGVNTKEELAGYVKWFGPAAADGAAIATPFSLSEFLLSYGATRISRDVNEGGRIILGENGTGTLEITPLFTASSSATATIQVFGFDMVDTVNLSKDTTGVRGSLINPRDNQKNKVLGIPYSLSRDEDSQTFALAANAETVKMSFVGPNNTIPVVDALNGTTYYVGKKVYVLTEGLWAFFAYVASVSAGNLALLARIR